MRRSSHNGERGPLDGIEIAMLTEQQINAIAMVSIGPHRGGTAFLVTPEYAITARHVVAGRTDPITLTFPGHAPVAATMVPGTSKQLDWALLECKAPAGIHPMRLSYFDRWHGNTWVSRGHGGLFGEHAGPIDGRFLSESPLELHCAALTTADKARGFSGAPLVTSSGVVGLISFTRVNEDGTVKAGFASAVTTRDIKSDWPRSAASSPISDPAPYVAALISYLHDVCENPALRAMLCERLQLDPPDRSVAAQRVAERLVELPWTTLSGLVAHLGRQCPDGLRELIGSMWVCREAACKLAGLMKRNNVTPGIRTKHYPSVRQHIMRAQGEDDRHSLITWGTESQHIFRANANSGETLVVVVEKALLAGLCIDAEELGDFLDANDGPVYKPMFVAINAIPTDAEVGAVRAKFGVHVKLIVHSQNAANDVFAQKPLQAELVEPVPDVQTELQAKILERKPSSGSNDR